MNLKDLQIYINIYSTGDNFLGHSNIIYAFRSTSEWSFFVFFFQKEELCFPFSYPSGLDKCPDLVYSNPCHIILLWQGQLSQTF